MGKKSDKKKKGKGKEAPYGNGMNARTGGNGEYAEANVYGYQEKERNIGSF
jgi:hypothetical protein